MHRCLRRLIRGFPQCKCGAFGNRSSLTPTVREQLSIITSILLSPHLKPLGISQARQSKFIRDPIFLHHQQPHILRHIINNWPNTRIKLWETYRRRQLQLPSLYSCKGSQAPLGALFFAASSALLRLPSISWRRVWTLLLMTRYSRFDSTAVVSWPLLTPVFSFGSSVASGSLLVPL